MEVFKGMIDLQGRLLELYFGDSFELFQRIVPVCTRCDLVAVGTLNCTLCSNALLCSACMAAGISMCPLCEKKGGQSPYTTSSVNRVAEQILESCSFNCPFPECERQNIPYRDFEYHFKSQCEHRRVFCPLGCGTHLKRQEVQIHAHTVCPMQPVNCPQCKEDSWNGKKLLRGTITDHFDKCEGFTTCETCDGVYKKGRNIRGQNFDHQCSDYLNRFLKQIVGTEAYETARHQIQDDLETLHSAPKPQFVVLGSLENIVTEQIKETGLKMERLMSQIQVDFQKRDILINTRLETAEFFIENQKITNQYLKPFVQAELTFAKVRKLPLVGSDAFSQFQWPSESQFRALTLENLAESKLKTLEWHVTGSLWSVCLNMSDGRTSGHIGTRNKLDQQTQFDASDTIVQVQLLESRDLKYCQGMRILGRKGNFQKIETLVEAIGADEAGEWQTFDLKPGELIVGVYGSVNSANNMRGLGFMVWEPLNTKQTQ